MVRSKATTVEQYLSSLNEDKRHVIENIRNIILSNLPRGYEEKMNWGMISYEVPLQLFAKTYNKKPLMYAALAAQKNYYSLYLMNIYQDNNLLAWFENEFKRENKKLNMGKSCIRFKSINDLSLSAIAKVVSSTSVKEFIEQYCKARNS